MLAWISLNSRCHPLWQANSQTETEYPKSARVLQWNNLDCAAMNSLKGDEDGFTVQTPKGLLEIKIEVILNRYWEIQDLYTEASLHCTEQNMGAQGYPQLSYSPADMQLLKCCSAPVSASSCKEAKRCLLKSWEEQLCQATARELLSAWYHTLSCPRAAWKRAFPLSLALPAPVTTFLQGSFTAFEFNFLPRACPRKICLREKQNSSLLFLMMLANICFMCFWIWSYLPLRSAFFKVHLKSYWSFLPFFTSILLEAICNFSSKRGKCDAVVLIPEVRLVSAFPLYKPLFWRVSNSAIKFSLGWKLAN